MAPVENAEDKLKALTQEVVICKLLTSNDPKVRKRGISSLKKWFHDVTKKSVTDEEDYYRIWNGLFYYVWMSDKPLIQEEAVETISNMIHDIDKSECVMYYIRGFFNSLNKQWDRISHYRIDKFLMFMRRFLRQILVLLKNHQWNPDELEAFSKELYSALQVVPYSVALHLNDIFNEEVAKVSYGKIPTDSLILLLKGYMECVAYLKPSKQVVSSINCSIFAGLARQLKLYIRQKAVTDDLEEVRSSKGSDDEDNGALDPRPGGVDVILPYIDFDETLIVDFIEKYRSKPGLSLKAKNIMTEMISMFNSITKLRTSVSNPNRLIHEAVQTNSRKRKQKRETMASLIKKSCKQLELDEAENEKEEDEKIIKKLERLGDIMQVKRTKRTSDWIITGTGEKSSAKKSRLSDGKNEWHVEQVQNKDENEETECVVETKPTRASGGKTEWIVEDTSIKEGDDAVANVAQKQDEVQIQDDEGIKLNLSSADDDFVLEISTSDWKTVPTETVDELVSKCAETIRQTPPKISPRRTRSKRKEPLVENKNMGNDHIIKIESNIEEPIQPVQPIEMPTTTDSIEPSKTQNLDVKLGETREPECKIETELEILKKVPTSKIIEEEKLTSSPRSVRSKRATTPQPIEIGEYVGTPRSLRSKRATTPQLVEIEKSVNSPKSLRSKRSETPQPIEIEKAVDSPRVLRSNRGGTPQPIEMEKSVSTPRSVRSCRRSTTPQPIETEKPVDTPRSVKAKRNLTFKTEKTESMHILEPVAEQPEVADESESAKLPSDNNSESVEDKKKRNVKKNTEISVSSGRKSLRIAEKQKKVEFNMRENCYQDIREYQFIVKSKPASPFDVLRIPCKSILKPCAVSSPINPFYFPSGERKLKRRGK